MAKYVSDHSKGRPWSQTNGNIGSEDPANSKVFPGVESWLVNYTQCRPSKYAEFDFGHVEFGAPVGYPGAVHGQESSWNLNFEREIQAEDIDLEIMMQR